MERAEQAPRVLEEELWEVAGRVRVLHREVGFSRHWSQTQEQRREETMHVARIVPGKLPHDWPAYRRVQVPSYYL